MAWSSESGRTTPLPADWPTLRRAALDRDGHRCTWVEHGQRCAAPATDVDHTGDPDDHRLAMLRSLCSPHHDARTAGQGVAERARLRALRRRPATAHPAYRRLR